MNLKRAEFIGGFVVFGSFVKCLFFGGGGSAVLSLVCCAVISIVSSFAVIALDCLLIPGDCLRSVALPHGAVGWSAVRNCGISWSYSLTVWFS